MIAEGEKGKKGLYPACAGSADFANLLHNDHDGTRRGRLRRDRDGSGSDRRTIPARGADWRCRRARCRYEIDLVVDGASHVLGIVVRQRGGRAARYARASCHRSGAPYLREGPSRRCAVRNDGAEHSAGRVGIRPGERDGARGGLSLKG